jgi:hypothetical protein
MAELSKSKRVEFKEGAQESFILGVKNRLFLDWSDMAKMLNISIRTLADWKKEKFSMSLDALEVLCKNANLPIPKKIKIKDPFWYAAKGARKGGLAKFKKYGCVSDPEKRKNKWQKWWKENGKNKKSSITNPLPFKRPHFSVKVAEFIGIVLGDGGMTKNQIKITLHSVDDLEYSIFIEKLMEGLFGIVPGKHARHDCQAVNITISRILLVKFCTEKLGLKIGNKIKQQVDIPNWVMENDEFSVACLRGLIDTDGCLIIHKYKSKEKYYTYKKIGFTSRSAPLLKSVSSILNNLGIKNRFSGKYDIRIEANNDVELYFKLVGTNNPKHLKRYGMRV